MRKGRVEGGRERGSLVAFFEIILHGMAYVAWDALAIGAIMCR